ncbi:flagellar hook protein FlgE [Paractinoplanes brasiliensis]|uniref:Flagellar hook protein FlgE n=1 Tax=Paractinoplanes brasiliensis TaxID=52695 RepID=A0A4V3C830_9ACTN|nr:flagellar hook protein FlgE [Actinoplanes brasiliensis]TDO40008.1 flagellar hook protein FlgE [Actinoplanes brasiliensis]GID25073.1 flagellar hook protein FlgE [Actinoplanes brasiliensis]
MLRSLYSGISGLHAHQQMMDVTGNNIANVNTVGFKASSVQFQDTLSQITGAAGAPQNGQAGTNPAQVGLGVRNASITSNFSQGSAQATGKAGDMMIQGDGFFITRRGNEELYSRAGSFFFDANGMLATATGDPVQGWTADEDGVVNPAAKPDDIKMPLGKSISPVATSTVEMKGNLTNDLPEGVTDPTTIPAIEIPFKAFDKTGNPVSLSAKFTRTTADPTASIQDWTVELTKSGEAGPTPAITATIQFEDGKPVVTPPATRASLSFAGVDTIAPNLSTTLDVDANDLTMFHGLSEARVSDSNGNAAGTLASLTYTVSDTGQIVGAFSNGQKKVLGQVALATFKNVNGLEKTGDSMWRSTVNSGLAQIGTPTSAGLGQVISGALEMSNVDLAQEFTNLVVAQRGFQANSRIITTSDELLQELVSMKR